MTDEDKEEGHVSFSSREEKTVQVQEAVVAREAFQMYSEAIGTPSRERYERRIEEGWDLESISPGFSVYRKLKEKTQCSTKHKESASVIQDREQQTTNSGLDLLATAALERDAQESQDAGMTSLENTAVPLHVSPVLVEVTRLPKVTGTDAKSKARKLVNSLPYSLTSTDAITEMSLKKLDFAKKAEKRKKCKETLLTEESKTGRD
jgi:hypothetical protein